MPHEVELKETCMKKVLNYFIAATLVLAFATPALANTKCSHRTASSSNDLFRNTNPNKQVAQAKVKTKAKAVRGAR